MESKVLHIFNSDDEIFNIDYDINDNILFWKTVLSINILVSGENSNKTKVIYNFNTGLGAFAFDWIYNYVFFDDRFNIIVAKIDETNNSYSISNKTSDEYHVGDICVNPIDLFVIWSESYFSDSRKGYIYKTRYDGSNKTSLANDNIVRPTSMQIDYTIKRIYVMDQIFNKLLSIDYNGNNMKLIYSSDRPFLFPSKMDLYHGFIYWLYDLNTIHKINIDGGELSQLKLHQHFQRAFKMIHPSRQPNTSNLCANTKCTHLCLPIDFNAYRCLCPDTKIYHLSESCEEYV
jgi:hypothetical protein